MDELFTVKTDTMLLLVVAVKINRQLDVFLMRRQMLMTHTDTHLQYLFRYCRYRSPQSKLTVVNPEGCVCVCERGGWLVGW